MQPRSRGNPWPRAPRLGGLPSQATPPSVGPAWMEPFADRQDAGRQLARHLQNRDVAYDLVAAIPRGGLAIGPAIARGLEIPLTVLVVEPIAAPGNPAITIGAATSDGSTWLKEDAILRLGIKDTYLGQAATEATEAARKRVGRYAEIRPPMPLEGQRVLLVDDSVTTGSTMQAAVRSARSQGADEVSLAVPVSATDIVEGLLGSADRVFCLASPSELIRVDQFYRSLPEITEEDALEILQDTPVPP